MDAIKKINSEELTEIIAEKGFDPDLTLKDFYITMILFLIKDIHGIYFKGGTALQKIFLDYARISEDIDFSLIRELSLVKKDIEDILSRSDLFHAITYDKNVEGFIRMVLHYKDFSGGEQTIFIDLNEKDKLLTKPETHKIEHFYKEQIPQFFLNTLSKEEMIAEKVAATIGRNKPRDHYDVYQIIRKNIPINMALVKKKCKSSGDEFSILRMFNNAKKLYKRWHEDLAPLLVEEISFEKMITTLANHFKLKKEKGRIKDKKNKIHK